jgi:hypothetical protein
LTGACRENHVPSATYVIGAEVLSRTVLSVAHAWGVETSGTEAATGCVGTVTVAGEHPCGTSVSVDPTARTVSFAGTLLRGQGTFQSILTGQVQFTAQ